MPVTFDRIATTTLASTSTSITFSSITNTYTDLRLVLSCGGMGQPGSIRIRTNGITSANYSYANLTIGGGSSSAGFGFAVSQSTMEFGSGTTDSEGAHLLVVDFLDYYRADSISKNIFGELTAQGGTGTSTSRTVSTMGRASTPGVAISSIEVYNPTFPIGTVATLYGIARA